MAKFGISEKHTMAIRVVEFSNGEYKIRKIFAQESTYPKKMIECSVLG